MDLEIGSVLEGKVSGITKFGAFVVLPGGSSGLVHISEIANVFVNDVNEFLSVGDTVKVKVIGINDAGKINLSIKQAASPAIRAGDSYRNGQNSYNRTTKNNAPNRSATRSGNAAPVDGAVHGPSGDASFEDKLKHFMQESDSKVSGNKLYADRRGNTRRRK